MHLFLLLTFPLLWLSVFVAILRVMRRSFKTINLKLLLLYVIFIAVLGPTGEIAVGHLYDTLISTPLWQYKIFPIHKAYTSHYAPVIWGISGAYLFLVHEELKLFSQFSRWQQIAIRALETIILEALLNVSFLLLSGSLIFYYIPADLFHITSLQTLPFYILLSVVVMRTMNWIKFHLPTP